MSNINVMDQLIELMLKHIWKVFFSHKIAFSIQSYRCKTNYEYLYNSELKWICQFQWNYFRNSTMVIIDDQKTIPFTRFEYFYCQFEGVVLKT